MNSTAGGPPTQLGADALAADAMVVVVCGHNNVLAYLRLLEWRSSTSGHAPGVWYVEEQTAEGVHMDNWSCSRFALFGTPIAPRGVYHRDGFVPAAGQPGCECRFLYT